MAMVRSVIRAEARDILSPKDALRRVNERVLADTKESVFVTVTFGVLDIPNQRFRFVRAGHEPTLLRREDIHAEIGVMRPQGMAVGLVPSETFGMIREAEIQLEPGDTVLLYTDGAVDAVNASSEEYGRKRLIDFLAEQQSQPPSELIYSLVEDVHQFSRGIPQHDDITLVAFRVMPKSAVRRRAEGRESQEEAPSRAAQTA